MFKNYLYARYKFIILITFKFIRNIFQRNGIKR